MHARRALLYVVAACALLAVSGVVYAEGSTAASSSSAPAGSASTYNVTFHESGLAAKTNWSVAVVGESVWGHHLRRTFETSNNSSIVFHLPNGTYVYRVAPVPGYYFENGSRGWFAVNGSSPKVLNVSFGRPVDFVVTFTETGLPAGTAWSVRLVVLGMWWGGPRPRQLVEHGTTASLTFSLPNGTYSYRVANEPGYYILGTAGHGKFNVTGAAVGISVPFRESPTYAVTFSESGLASHANWSVLVFSTHPSPLSIHWTIANTSTIVFDLTNGTYHFLVRAPGYNVTNNSSGTFVVDGASPATIQVTFVQEAWPVWPVAPRASVPAPN